MGVQKSRWAFRSSKSALGRVAVQGGFDSHALPLRYRQIRTYFMEILDQQVFTDAIQRVFRISDITAGDINSGYLLRYRGNLIQTSDIAHEALCDQLMPLGFTPLLRREPDGNIIILIIQSLPQQSTGKPWVNGVLFFVTAISVIYTGMGYTEPQFLAGITDQTQMLWLSLLHGGLPFAFSLLGILLAHEFGHYFAAKFHNTHSTLPYFLPFPTLLGTMGAVIIWKDIPRNKRVVFDVGIAGPLAGLIISIPIVLYGLSISTLGAIQSVPGGFIEGNSLIYLFSKFAIFQKFLPEPASFGDSGAFFYWLKYFFTGQPAISSGVDVYISPVAMAGWAGLLVTSLNLIPAGQLDGGHVIGALLGSQKTKLLPVILATLGILGLYWSGWWLWAFILLLTGNRSIEPLDDVTELDSKRKILGFLMVIIFILVFIPVPLIPMG